MSFGSLLKAKLHPQTTPSDLIKDVIPLYAALLVLTQRALVSELVAPAKVITSAKWKCN